MSEWKNVKVEDILLVPSRNGLTKPSAIRGKGVKMIAMGELFAHPIIRDIETDRVPVTEKELQSSNIEVDDLLFARQSLTLEGAGKCSIIKEVKEPTVFESHLIRLRINKKLADSWFVYYYFNSYKGKHSIQNIVNQVAAAGIKGSDLVKLVIPLPPLDIQKGISSTLFDFDDKIAVNRRICENLEAQAQALFKHWFIDFAPFKNGKFVESELGMIPEGWRVGKFTDIFDLGSGGTPKTSEKLYWEDGSIPFFSPKDVNGVYCFDTEKHITEKGLNNCSSSLYSKNTIFITCRGTVGKIAMAAVPMAMNQSNYAILSNKGYSQYFAYLMTVSIVKKLKFKANGAVFDAITSKDFKEQIIIPNLNVVNRFDSIIQPIFDNILNIGFENLRLSTLRDTLLPKLMSGQIKV